MKRTISSVIVLLVFLLLISAIGFACDEIKPVGETGELQPVENGVKPVGEAGQLQPVEIKEYQGEKLSSINEFSENSIKGPQHVNLESYRLKVSGLVENPGEYVYEQVINSHQSYEKVVTLDCVEGWSVTILWRGLLVRDLLAEAKVLPDAKVVIFHAYDGYTTSLPVDYLINNDILIAYKMNGVTLPPERGFPFQLVAESKWGYKWIKWITEIELSDDVNYRGYWERRGYSNNADLDKDFFGK
jgi:DMSO/TMAO reductase YedYZ molybdopterin-dependent catalytic subunit